MRLALVALTLSLAACSGAPKTARVEPLAPELAPLVATLLTEPIGCPIYAGDDRPEYDAQGLECLVKWMKEARAYLDAGGKPSKYTNEERFEDNRAMALKLQSRLAVWLKAPRPNAVVRRAPAPKAPRSASTVDSQASQQSYLSGMIYFQRGEYEKARAEWTAAVKLDPSNADAKAGLAKLDQLYSPP